MDNAGASADGMAINGENSPECFAHGLEHVHVQAKLKCLNARLRHWLGAKSRGLMKSFASIWGIKASCPWDQETKRSVEAPFA